MDEKSINVLEFIRDHPLCESGEMDGFTLQDLEEMGCIKAIDVTTDDNNGVPEFIEMRITNHGEAIITDYYTESRVNDLNLNSKSKWHDKALGKIFISVVSIILATFLLLSFSKYLGIGE